jgi:beta-glucanase (GH16 family)
MVAAGVDGHFIGRQAMKITTLISLFLAIVANPGFASSIAVIPPAQAAAAGFRKLSFDGLFKGPLDISYDSSETRGRHKWNAGLWWECVPPASAFRVQNGILTITATASHNVDLCTQYHDASGGKYFLGGYFEARMLCTDWSAFWLFCAKRPAVYGNRISASNTISWTNEIDIIETDPGSPNTAFCTLHSNTSGDGGVPDQLNEPHAFALACPVIATWHTYGLLWTREQITWYIDNVKVASARPFASTWQPAQLILSAGPGGANGSASTVLTPVTQVQWVRVWEK